jgi:hypothetical protein
MRRLVLFAAVPLIAAVASPALANDVAGITVPGGPSPQVASSYPAEGAAVPGGVLVIKVTFDQPMTADAWAYGQAEGANFPHCLSRPRLLADGKSFALLCTVVAQQAYAIAINPAPKFTGANFGRAAKPMVLHFTTSNDPEVRDMQTALDKAGLKDVDEPVMDWTDAGKGVSQSPSPPAN